MLNNGEEFGGDPSRVVLGGDSAGGNVVAVLTQQLLKDQQVKHQPKIQVLIYPWVQLANSIALPSSAYYSSKLWKSVRRYITKFVSWYLGNQKISKELEASFLANNHFMLLDEAERNKYISYMDVDKIPTEYKKGKSYYDEFDIKNKYPSKVDENCIFRRDPEMGALYKKLFSPEISPLFAELNNLKGLPRAYVLILEWDGLKGEHCDFNAINKN
jgi:acetyl esterase/lipase